MKKVLLISLDGNFSLLSRSVWGCTLLSNILLLLDSPISFTNSFPISLPISFPSFVPLVVALSGWPCRL